MIINKENNLGKNIKFLREYYGKTQTELANEIDLESSSTLSQYENGDRYPKKEILKRLTAYFKITEDELLYSDLSNLGKLNLSILNKDINQKFFANMFPLITNSTAMKNKNFKMAYALQNKLYDEIKEEKELSETYFEDIYDKICNYYNKAYNDGIVEALVNSESLEMFIGYSISIYSPYLNDMIDIYGDLSPEQMIDIIFLNPQSQEHIDEYKNSNKKNNLEKIQYILDTEKSFLKNMNILKHTNEYADIAEYFITFRYLLGLYNNDLTDEQNILVGKELTLLYSKMGNKYINNVMDISKNK